MQINSTLQTALISTAFILLFNACGGGSSRSSDDIIKTYTPATLSGTFIDAKVKGLRYKTASQNSVTDAEGSFRYREGENIEFFLGNLSLGSAKAAEIITPYTLTGDTDFDNPKDKTLNIALLLQNFDANRADKEQINVANLQSYNFSDIDLSVSTSTMESIITDLLATGSFQKLIDTNNSLITTQTAKDRLNTNIKGESCPLPTITDDSSYSDIFPKDIKWEGDSSSVEDIERVFNNARANDPTISQKLVMPSQEKWDDMTIEERGLYLLNNERYYRGIKPFEGISSRVSAISQDYAQYLYDHGVFGHEEDGTPWERLDRDEVIKNNRDFFKYAENLYVHGSSSHYQENPIAKAIYGFIYDDDASTGGSYGHRKFCLATALKDNSGESGKEGLVGFGIKRGTEYSKYDGYYSTIVVMNAFDPSSTWDHSTTHSIPFCTPTPSSK